MPPSKNIHEPPTSKINVYIRNQIEKKKNNKSNRTLPQLMKKVIYAYYNRLRGMENLVASIQIVLACNYVHFCT